ncbi:MAG: AMP-binding protein [Bacilli bacterium]|nr:AMP-binding protein [Bacilli bacterium]
MSQYTKVKAFCGRAKELLNTSRRMEDIFNELAKGSEKATACKFINEEGKIKKYNYATLKTHAYENASVLSQILFEKPKHKNIILKMPNSPHWGEVFWAILMAGYRPLLVDFRTTKEGTENMIEKGKALAIITDDAYSYSCLKISLEDILSGEKVYSFTPTWENEVIFCSSGTTGDVKMMVYNGENLVNQICESLEIAEENFDLIYPGKIKILAMVPFHHIFGFVAVFLWYTYYGKTIVYPASTTPTDILYICQKCKVTHVFSVPLFWDGIAKNVTRKMAMEGPEKVALLDKMVGYYTNKITKKEAGLAGKKVAAKIVHKKLLGNSVRFCISGGGFLSTDTLTTINGLGYPLYNGYGMTEVGVTSVELSPKVEERLKGSIGHPFHGVEYRINPKNGELMIKSEAVHIKEIIGGVEKYTELEDGFFRTGDIVEADAKNCFYIKGRIKDIIVNADGENIFPDELEIFFSDLPKVNQLSVLGIAKKNSKDENVVLVLELDNKVTDSELKEIQAKVDDIKLPHGVKVAHIYLSKNKLPLANGMKVKRFVVKKAIESGSPDFVLINAKKETKSFEGFDDKTISDILIPTREIFSKILILPAFKIEDGAHWVNDLGGDSMSYVELIKDVQDRFNVTIPEELYGKLTCVNDFVLEIAQLKKIDVNSGSDKK